MPATSTGRASAVRPASSSHSSSARDFAAGDIEVGQLFSELRRALSVPVAPLAQLLQTTPETVMALETGELAKLPPWNETERVVRLFTGLAGIDPAAVLVRIKAGMDRPQARALVPVTAPVRALPQRQAAPPRRVEAKQQPAPSARGSRETETRSSIFARLRAMSRPALSASRSRIVILAGIGAILAATLVATTLLAAMPAPVRRAIASAYDRLTVRTVTMPDGMRLIDVGDPRARRSDKLHTAGR